MLLFDARACVVANPYESHCLIKYFRLEQVAPPFHLLIKLLLDFSFGRLQHCQN